MVLFGPGSSCRGRKVFVWIAAVVIIDYELKVVGYHCLRIAVLPKEKVESISIE